MKRKWLKILAGVLGIGIILTLAAFANALVGNPVSSALARRSARQLLSEAHAGSDYVIEDTGYNFKTGGYWVHIQSPSSPDGTFSVYTDGLGRYQYDTYEYDVLRHGNTARRLRAAYRAAGDAVFDAPTFPFDTDVEFTELEFGDSDYPYAIPTEELEQDGEYDVAALGARAGRLVIYFMDEDVSPERLAELLPEVKARLDAAGVPFRAVDSVLRRPKPTDGSPWSEEQINILDFPAEALDPDGLTERIAAADAEAKAYYAKLDEENAKLFAGNGG